MTAPTTHTFAGLPSMVPAYARVLLGKKPYISAANTSIRPIELNVRKVVISAKHLQQYREICGVRDPSGIPPAYLHVLAMPLHMQLFIARDFPVKVLGLIHLRNTIRVLGAIDTRAPLTLRVFFDTARFTEIGQEYDFTTIYHQNGIAVWEEVSTMFARGNAPPKDGAKRGGIERSAHPATGTSTEALEIAENTGWRYAKVSGDF